MFIDFSSAFNTMRPTTLIRKLQSMGVCCGLCWWILDYLHGRTQQVRVNDCQSGSVTTTIGAPQGCVLSPVLFTIYTDDHRSDTSDVIISKFADDTAIIGLISDRNETAYRNSIDSFVRRCSTDDLELNVTKTKEMVVDFRTHGGNISSVTILGSEVDRVAQYKYLGTVMTSNLYWSANTE